jgi:ribosomal protein L19E
MSKETLYWLGRGVLGYKDKDGKEHILEYADEIPEGALTDERISKLMKDGVIGTKPAPVKANEVAQLRNKVAEQKGVIEALKAGEDGKAAERVGELEEELQTVKAEKASLETEKTDLENKLENVRKELDDVKKAAGSSEETQKEENGNKDTPSGSGVSAKTGGGKDEKKGGKK